MVIFDFSSCAVVLLLLLLMSVGELPVFVIGIIIAVLATIGSMYQPAVQASVPTLVGEEKLARANGIVNGVGALSFLLGPVMGGVLYGIIGLEKLVVISCVAFFLSAVMEIFIQIPFVKRISDKKIIATILNDTKDGFRYIVKNNPFILKVLSLAATLNLSFSPLFIIGTPFILRVAMKSNDVMYGFGLGLLQLSTIIGALLTGVFSKRLKISRLYISFIVMAVLMLPMALAVTPAFLELGYWLPFILFFVFTIIVVSMSTIISIFIITDIQKRTPKEMLGKVMAILMAVSQIASPLGQMLFGILFKVSNNTTYIPVLIASAFAVIVAIGAKQLLKNI
jgi:MFS family permease